MGKRFTYYAVGSTFHPLNLAGSQLYFAKNTATPSLWNDQSPNGYDLTQSTATQQPIISANSVDFDGVNDVLFRNIANPFSGHTLGTFYFSFYFNGNRQELFASADASSDIRLIAFQANTVFGNKLSVISIRGSSPNRVNSTDSLVIGYNYGYIASNGSNYILSLNGVLQTNIVIVGNDDGTWFGNIASRDNISIGGVLRSSSFYSPTKLNKAYYNNTILSAGDITKLNTFFADPNNY